MLDFVDYIYGNFDEEADTLEIPFDSFTNFFSRQIDFFATCVFTKNCYRQRWITFDELPRTFGIMDFLKNMWNHKKLLHFDYYIDEHDKDGNLIFIRGKHDLQK